MSICSEAFSLFLVQIHDGMKQSIHSFIRFSWGQYFAPRGLKKQILGVSFGGWLAKAFCDTYFLSFPFSLSPYFIHIRRFNSSLSYDQGIKDKTTKKD